MTLTLSDLPLLNACLNGTSAILLTIGYIQIRKQRQIAHRNCMIAAFTTSTLFLASYLYYHAHAKTTHFVNPAWFRPIYLTILLTHTLLAVVIVPMVFITFSRALKQKFDRHKSIARWTWPIWMYVSLTGVVIYLILYQIFPQAR
jgi:putative membrane protein